jgi:hypothetical protein
MREYLQLLRKMNRILLNQLLRHCEVLVEKMERHMKRKKKEKEKRTKKRKRRM